MQFDTNVAPESLGLELENVISFWILGKGPASSNLEGETSLFSVC